MAFVPVPFFGLEIDGGFKIGGLGRVDRRVEIKLGAGERALILQFAIGQNGMNLRVLRGDISLCALELRRRVIQDRIDET